MTPEEHNIKLHRMSMIENIITLAAIVLFLWIAGLPYGLLGLLLLSNLNYVRRDKLKEGE